MSRVRACQLALVNWRGVFFERYLLDERVTALEGSNGAGKTTVMIAAYIVLLPDMTRLRFTSVGEQSATGGDKGIYGRLGDLGRPTYAALDFRLAGSDRLIAGVQLERRSEPTVEPTPFLITGLPDAASLADILLDRSGEVDAVPDLQRIRELSALAGGTLVTFASTKEYFTELFDRGITPLRLTGDEERSKYNEMLRTSMVGGISRALTGGLREFLLKEETGLADTLKRMRGNLDACRRTRQEVGEARELEQEIRGVYEAGQEMFAAAAHATRQRAQELLARVDGARSALGMAEQVEGERDRDLRAVLERRKETKAELDAARAEHTVVVERRDRTRLANEIEGRIRAAEVAHENAVCRRTEAEATRDERDSLRERARLERDGASRDRDGAAEGLANARRGLEELERKATEYRMARDRLADVQKSLERPAFTEDDAPSALKVCSAQIERFDGEIVELDRTVETAERRRREFESLRAALQRIVGANVDARTAHETAREALAQLRQLDELAALRSVLPARIDAAHDQAIKQRSAREAAQRLSTETRSISSASDVQDAHEESEAASTAHEERRARASEEAATAEQALEIAKARAVQLADQARSFRETRGAADALATQWQHAIAGRADVDALRSALRRREDETRTALSTAQAERDRLRADANRLEQTGGRFDDQLLAARDLVEGELLAGRFEDVTPDNAGRIQALLGPLHEAIIVEDLHLATQRLAASEKRPSTVWLVGPDGLPNWEHAASPPGIVIGNDVLVPGEAGSRLTRISEQPILGRRAREARITALRREERTADKQIEALRPELRALGDGLERVDRLSATASVLELGDPTATLDLVRADVMRLTEVSAIQRSTEREAKMQGDASRARCRQLARLLPQAHLLDADDFAAEARRLETQLAEAKKAQTELQRVASDRARLERELDVLTSAPPSVEQVEALRIQKAAIEAERDRQARVAVSLRYVDVHRAAFAWGDAEVSLLEQRALAPALGERLERAKVALSEAEALLTSAESSREDAIKAFQIANAAVAAIEERVVRDKAQLTESGIDDASDEALAGLRARVDLLRTALDQLDAEERTLGNECVRCEGRLHAAHDDADRCRETLASDEKVWRPADENWAKLRDRAEAQGVLTAAFTRAFEEKFANRGNVNLWPLADNGQILLVERLGRAKDGVDLATEVKRLLAAEEASRGSAYLDAWLASREWLRRRVPAQIADVSEPLEALARLRESLLRLEDRLSEQEGALRGQSSDVANNISVQVRKAKRHLIRLNEDLANVRFGSIRGVRIRPGTIDRMEQVLLALRAGEAQELLFQTSMPIEEAMDELFRRYGGGRTGGLRLLDYREYIELQVEVRRQASVDWEPANPTRMSTGEGIGVGAAVMMVVLTAWERDANLLRAKRSSGTLRLLFLDEATRLSQDNLSILFDLCQSLDLQLIIAAPEVARAEGNTTYRLVRTVGEDGREEVLVTGRRTIGAETVTEASG